MTSDSISFSRKQAGEGAHLFNVTRGWGTPTQRVENPEKVGKSKRDSYIYEVSGMRHKIWEWISGHHSEGNREDQGIVTGSKDQKNAIKHSCVRSTPTQTSVG